MQHKWIRTGERFLTVNPQWHAQCSFCGQHCLESDQPDGTVIRWAVRDSLPFTKTCDG